ncbi:hypothetical protein [Thioclava sp. A2]|uniref:hypothetical protein n=1 Tax=Thioclava sp. FCG-A2 TaxID=3080562 RepID=UPI0029537C82|nr:hypothetical protein [Thioclava sp. A2]
MVEFILPGSTTAFKKMPLCQRDGARLHFGTPLREGQKRRGQLMAAIKAGQGICLGLCHHDEPHDHGVASC